MPKPSTKSGKSAFDRRAFLTSSAKRQTGYENSSADERYVPPDGEYLCLLEEIRLVGPMTSKKDGTEFCAFSPIVSIAEGDLAGQRFEAGFYTDAEQSAWKSKVLFKRIFGEDNIPESWADGVAALEEKKNCYFVIEVSDTDKEYPNFKFVEEVEATDEAEPEPEPEPAPPPPTRTRRRAAAG